MCETTLSDDTKVKVAALQCLCVIVGTYYALMEPYMGPALFGVRGFFGVFF